MMKTENLRALFSDPHRYERSGHILSRRTNACNNADNSLPDEIDKALSQHVQFDGSFYHSTTTKNAPNPCIKIDRLGLVGLPLGHRDAQAIIKRATPVACSRGEKSLRMFSHKSSQTTWEIEPAKITFSNPVWSTYLRSTILPKVMKSLGVKVPASNLKMELNKLLLYESGSPASMELTTQSPEGSFASIVISLPSQYSGGEVILQYSTSTKTIDFSSDSKLSTSILAWYDHGVRHEIKPVTSGHRLSLAFNLIYVAPVVGCLAAPPSLPSASAGVARLREIFQKWKAGGFTTGVPRPNLIVYLRDEDRYYDSCEEGPEDPKGPDSYRIKSLLEAARAEGIVVGEGMLEIRQSGPSEDIDDAWNRPITGDTETECEEVPNLAEVEEESIQMSEVAALRDHDLDGLSSITFDEYSVGCLIPKRELGTLRPQSKDFDDLGSETGAGHVDQYCGRSAYILFPETNLPAVRMWCGLARLGRSNESTPVAEVLQCATSVLNEIQAWTASDALSMLRHALKFKNETIWVAASKSVHVTIAMLGEAKLLSSVRSVFGFEKARPAFEMVLSRSTHLQGESIQFIKLVSSQAPKTEKQRAKEWALQETRKLKDAATGPLVGSSIPGGSARAVLAPGAANASVNTKKRKRPTDN